MKQPTRTVAVVTMTQHTRTVVAVLAKRTSACTAALLQVEITLRQRRLDTRCLPAKGTAKCAKRRRIQCKNILQVYTCKENCERGAASVDWSASGDTRAVSSLAFGVHTLTPAPLAGTMSRRHIHTHSVIFISRPRHCRHLCIPDTVPQAAKSRSLLAAAMTTYKYKMATTITAQYIPIMGNKGRLTSR